MACSEPLSSVGENMSVDASSRKPRILLAASGSVAAIKFANLCRSFSEWAEVRAVATNASLHFIDRTEIPKDVILYTDEDEWSSWKKLGDGVLHIELRKWADIMVIAPLSANTLGKIAGGLCDNLLTSIVRAWDYNKPFFVAPAMNTFMWNNPFTERHLISIDELGISLIPPVTKRLACGDYGNGAMAEPSTIYSTAVAMVKRTPAYKNRLKALELERSGGITNRKKSQRNMDKKVEEDLSNELDLQISGTERPSVWTLVGVRFVLLPYTLGKLLLWYGCWFWRYKVKKCPYSWNDACYLTQSSLGVPDERWKSIDEGKKEDLVLRRLWEKSNMENYMAEMRKESKRRR